MKKSNEGFTLIELIIVIAILAITLTLTSDILISLVRSNNKTVVKDELEQQANFVALKLEKELRNARDAEINSGNLSFTLEGGQDATYSLDGEVLQKDSVPITSNHPLGGVVVSCPSGACFGVEPGPPQLVTIDLLFTPKSGGGLGSFSGEIKVNTTIVLRNTY